MKYLKGVQAIIQIPVFKDVFQLHGKWNENDFSSFEVIQRMVFKMLLINVLEMT